MMSSKKESNQSYYMAEPKNEEYINRIVNGILDRRLREKSYIDVLPSKMISPAYYVIYKSGSLVKAMNGETGGVLSSNSDAATVIQAAIDARTYAQKNSILFKAGNFTITKQVDLKGNLNFQGAGIDITRLTAADQSQDYDILSWTPTSNEYFLSIRDLTVEGDGTDGTSGRNIYFDDEDGGNTSDCHIDHIMSIHAVGDGIYARNNWGFKLTNSISEYSGGINLNLGTVSQNYIQNCFFAYAKGNYGVKINSPKVLFCNNNVYQNERVGILLTGSVEKQTISNNMINGNGTVATSDGLWVDSNNHEVVICNNQIYDNSDYGLDLDADDCIVEGNNIVNNTNGQIANSGDRNVINGLSNNAGVPGVAGVWATVTRDGVIVRDTTNNKTYIYAGGGWREISAT